MRNHSAARAGSREPPDVAVSVRNLSVRYAGASESALEIDALDVAPGEKVALLGPNGGGKTTFLAVLAGFVPYAGEVRVCGAVPCGRSLRHVRERIGVLFENPDDQFLYPTVREDVADALARRGVPAAEMSARWTSGAGKGARRRCSCSLHRRMHLPGPKRPARPLRCSACA